MAHSELIDTLWNVNTNMISNKRVPVRINRYIMECKLKMFATEGAKKFQELIDTLWNVNLSMENGWNYVKRINRYIMECKSPSG